MIRVATEQVSSTILKTLIAAKLIDGFWERWLAHGVDADDLAKIRHTFNDLECWVEGWSRLARQKQMLAEQLERKRELANAEMMHRSAGLYFYLVQWIYPDVSTEKQGWFERCSASFQQADTLSPVPVQYTNLKIDGHPCFGRVRIPNHPKACMVIINPFDSSKEELFRYEMDFVHAGMATVSFDGPGQGETFVASGFKGTLQRWDHFLDRVIEEAAGICLDIPICLFGTSSGASWALLKSNHPHIDKAVAVSPAVSLGIEVPAYFQDRINQAWEGKDHSSPLLEEFSGSVPVLLFHGKRDVLVATDDIYQLMKRLPQGKLIEYENEGHCCNFKLEEIRRITVKWLLQGETTL